MADRKLRPMPASSRKNHVLLALVVIAGIGLSWVANSWTMAAENGDVRVVLLNDGRVFRGRLTEVAGGYRVDNGASYVILPFTEIKLTANSLKDAYETLRGAMRNPNAPDHMQLAEWCLKQQLIAEARTEVASALQLEPDRTDARVMLQRLDRIVQPPTFDTTRASSPLWVDSFVKPPERNEHGLTADTMRDFVTRVQPLLMNSCGMANCHGSAAKNDFHIDYARIGSPGHRQATDDNLKSVLARLDPAQPLKSSLLTEPGRPVPHHRELFRGNLGARQSAILRDWLQSAAREVKDPVRPKAAEIADSDPVIFRPDEPAPELSQNDSPRRDDQVQPASFDVQEQPQSNSAVPLPISNSPVKTAESGNPERLLDQLRRRHQPDAFDPDIFNRKVHGVSAAEARHR